MLDVMYYYIFLDYKIDGSVMVTFIQKQNSLYFFRYELQGVTKSLCLYINDGMMAWGVTMFRKYIKIGFVSLNRCWDHHKTKTMQIWFLLFFQPVVDLPNPLFS